MTTLSICALLLLTSPAAAGEEPALVRPFESHVDLTPHSAIDRLVLTTLKELDIQPAKVCSDQVFIRRVYLDVIGTLPTPQEVRTFLQDKTPGKRGALIDRLLGRKEFADYWAMKWSDLLRVKAEFPINLWPNGVQAYYRWIHTSIKENKPYDQFAREMLTASGSNFRAPPVNFYRALQGTEPQTIAQAVALTFMGTRTKNWSKERVAGMAAFFSYLGYKRSGEWKEEILFFDSLKAAKDFAAGASRKAVFPDGTRVQLSEKRDPRQIFADWLIRPDNPWFARTIVNRIWYWLQGRGIVHEPDDLRPDNPPRNLELLAFLEKKLVKARYDLKHVYRLILNSRTYQLSSIPRTDHPEAEACFAFYPLRQLEAEVLIDALCQITGTTEEYFSPIPEPFTYVPETKRSIALADGSITSSFLEMFGRPPRDTGLMAERNTRPTPAQRLHLLNSSHIKRKIEQGSKLKSIMRSGRDPKAAVTRLYLAILSRFPTQDELNVVQAYSTSGTARGREVAVDVAWALINSPEFLYRH